MLQPKQAISITDFNEGLYTGYNFLQGNVNQSPDCINIKWNFDGSLEKRLGSSTANSVALESTGGWASFDFGATDRRWYVISNGTGISASSNGCTTFVSVHTSRTQTYQYFERSLNVCIATSEERTDTTLFWPGSTGTQFEVLAPNSAPNAKYSINYQGFLILLNCMDSTGAVSPRRFYYADEAAQLTDDWNDFFDLPSSQDDEITGPFVLSKRLYVSTRYRILRVTFVGGNPDWSYLEIKDWGFVPRTMKKITLEGGEVVVGLDWNRRLRVFDGVDDLISSKSVERDNGMSEFALDNVSYAGSGLIVSHAEVDRIEQEYRLNLAVGSDSSETTHALILNGRNLAFYPYRNQLFQSMAMMESANRLFLMACDRSGFVHILNSGNTDTGVAIDDHYDLPFLFKRTPGEISRGQQIDLFFSQTSSGTIYIQDRADFSSVFSDPIDRFELVTSNSLNQLVRSIDIPSVHNVWQGRVSSSSGTADPWRLNRVDYYLKNLGVGRGN